MEGSRGAGGHRTIKPTVIFLMPSKPKFICRWKSCNSSEKLFSRLLILNGANHKKEKEKKHSAFPCSPSHWSAYQTAFKKVNANKSDSKQLWLSWTKVQANFIFKLVSLTTEKISTWSLFIVNKSSKRLLRIWCQFIIIALEQIAQIRAIISVNVYFEDAEIFPYLLLRRLQRDTEASGKLCLRTMHSHFQEV